MGPVGGLVGTVQGKGADHGGWPRGQDSHPQGHHSDSCVPGLRDWTSFSKHPNWHPWVGQFPEKGNLPAGAQVWV